METIEEQSNSQVLVTSQPSFKICLVGKVANDDSAMQAALSYGVPVIMSETGLDVQCAGVRIIYIVDDFDGYLFDIINYRKGCILGPPALKMKPTLGLNYRPLYNYAMRGVVACFTGIRNTDELIHLVHLIHSMGGCIKKHLSHKVTHLICLHCRGEKYEYAMIFRLTVVPPAWVYAAWSARNRVGFDATQESFTTSLNLHLFEGQKICFVGFPPEKHVQMVDHLLVHGGHSCKLEDSDCSHVVVNENTTTTKPEPANKFSTIVISDWFWHTLNIGFANAKDYLFADYLEGIPETPNTTDRSDSRKRKHLEDTPSSSGKRLLSDSTFIDCPDKSPSDKPGETEIAKKSMRFNHFMDFFNTESNYVGILDTILKLFKNKLEDLAETQKNAVLNESEIESIFGNFLPIHKVHQSMLEQLRKLQANWHEDCLIGDIIMQHHGEMIKAYPPYVNCYEEMKEQLQRCVREYPRFHNFLEMNKLKPECGRQSLADLMIRPVQRLPSISLLLSDILKHTNASNLDHGRLEKALIAIKHVTLYINEDKRRTEQRLAMFNDIEGFPGHLVSTSRDFISKCAVSELSDSLSGRGDNLVLILFSDMIELCKRKSWGFNPTKSPRTSKTYKHVKLISWNTVRFVIDIIDSPRAFGLLLSDENENMYTFSITDEAVDKSEYVKNLCMQIAAHTCRTDANNILLCRTSSELQVDINDTNGSAVRKAFKLAAKTRLKVKRSLSFSKTPN